MPNHPNPITVIRLGYRVGRDPRINTHLGLVYRALGADEFLAMLEDKIREAPFF